MQAGTADHPQGKSSWQSEDGVTDETEPNDASFPFPPQELCHFARIASNLCVWQSRLSPFTRSIVGSDAGRVIGYFSVIRLKLSYRKEPPYSGLSCSGVPEHSHIRNLGVGH